MPQADRSRLQQLFENLLRNAVEHGEADVTVTIGELVAGFFVEDDCPGIPSEEREDIFDLYKGHQDVEVTYDAMKNTLEADKTYLQSADAVAGISSSRCWLSGCTSRSSHGYESANSPIASRSQTYSTNFRWAN